MKHSAKRSRGRFATVRPLRSAWRTEALGARMTGNALGVALALLGLVAVALGCGDADVGPVPADAEVVVLLHGLARTDVSMQPLEAPLREAGFEVRNIHYPSTDASPAELVAFLHAELKACCLGAARMNFVTHSLGGILTRAYLAEHPAPTLGRVVMLAPPNHGSELVDVLGENELFQWAMGPTATELGTDGASLPNRLPPATFELGVIAGKGSVNPLGELVIPGESDGTVSVESTQLSGMKDFITVPASHTFIMFSKEVAAQVVAFLRTGRFVRHES
jgi:triacylglycerol lipase